MNSKPRLSLPAGTLFLTLFITTPASATLIHGQAIGVIDANEAIHEQGEGNTVFGLGAAELAGQAFTVNFSIDTELAPTPRILLADPVDMQRITYKSTEENLEWLTMSITVNSHTYTIQGDTSVVDILDADSSSPFNNSVSNYYDELHVAISSFSTSPDGTIIRNRFLDLSPIMSSDSINSLDITSPFSTTEFYPSSFFGGFSISEFDLDPITNDVLYARMITFDLDIQSVSTTVVPLPSAAWLFLSGIIGLIGLTRKKRLP